MPVGRVASVPPAPVKKPHLRQQAALEKGSQSPQSVNQVYLSDSDSPAVVHSEDGVKNETRTSDDSVVVYPGVTNTIYLSSTDENLFTCQVPIKSIVSSTEKGVKIEFIPGTNYAFLKWQFALKANKEIYASIQTEVFVLCGDDIYKLIAIPKKITSVTVRLSSGVETKIKKNISYFSGMPLEKKIMQFVKLAYTESIPDSFDVVKPNKLYSVWQNLDIVLREVVTAEGEGLLCKVYHVTNTSGNTVQIDERAFLKKELTRHTLGISIGDGKYTLGKNEGTDVFIIEQKGGTDNGQQQQRRASGFGD